MKIMYWVPVAIVLASFNIAPAYGQSHNLQKIHDEAFTIDSHCDTPLWISRSDIDMGIDNSSNRRSKVDFVRMKEGGLDAIIFAVFVGQGERTQEKHEAVFERADAIIDSIYAELDRNTDLAVIAKTPSEAFLAEKAGLRSVFLGMENGYPIGTDIERVAHFYDRGIRYITLCHTSNNEICDSSTDDEGPEHNGLSPFGEEVVREMNRLGMIIDVSHISDSTFFDVIKLSKTPVIASHSCARNLQDHPRNLSDEMLQALAENNGVIQVCFVSEYLKHIPEIPEKEEALLKLREKYGSFASLDEKKREQAVSEYWAIQDMYPDKLATVNDIVDHIDHIVAVAGINHVGIGTDFDGGGEVSDCYDVSEMANITKELIARGYTEKEVKLIWGGNFMRVFEEVVEVSRELKN